MEINQPQRLSYFNDGQSWFHVHFRTVAFEIFQDLRLNCDKKTPTIRDTFSEAIV